MKLSQAFPSKYLKAGDLQGRHISVVIDGAEMVSIGDDGDKLALYFVGKSKGMICNVTNANMISEILGTEETDEWIGKTIVLYSAKVDFQGRRVDAIRVQAPAGNGATGRPRQDPAQPPPPPPPPTDDDCPF